MLNLIFNKGTVFFFIPQGFKSAELLLISARNYSILCFTEMKLQAIVILSLSLSLSHTHMLGFLEIPFTNSFLCYSLVQGFSKKTKTKLKSGHRLLVEEHKQLNQTFTWSNKKPVLHLLAFLTDRKEQCFVFICIL